MITYSKIQVIQNRSETGFTTVWKKICCLTARIYRNLYILFNLWKYTTEQNRIISKKQAELLNYKKYYYWYLRNENRLEELYEQEQCLYMTLTFEEFTYAIFSDKFRIIYKKMKPEQYYFKYGCPCCGGKVEFLKETFTYKCFHCGCFASAHRSNSEHSKKYEPYQYMANEKINDLRKSLEQIFNKIWQKRILYRRTAETRKESFINIICSDNIRALEKDELLYVRVLNYDKEQNTCDVYAYDTATVIENVQLDKLKAVSNRGKAYVWLAEQLGINVPSCQIGYLSETDLKEAIKICHSALLEARRKAIDSTNQ